MADIAGISGSFGFDPSRSNAAEDRRTSEEDRRADEAARAAEETDAGSATNESAASNGTGTTTEIGTDQNTTARQEREVDEDQVTISNEAQQRLDEEAATPAAGAADVQTLTPANDTNQATRQENSTTVVNGNRDDQSEQSRSLGQLVDQFA